MTDQMAARRSIDPANDPEALRTGLDLTRASQLTMLRLQLALHTANRRTAMQALDDLLDIDAEIEGYAATLGGAADPARAALAGFIGLQKAAIAVEKHGLAGGDGRSEVRPLPKPEDRTDAVLPVAEAEGIEAADLAERDLPAQSMEDDAEGEERSGRRLWLYALAVVLLVALIAVGLVAYLRPDLLVTAGDAVSRILASALAFAGW